MEIQKDDQVIVRKKIRTGNLVRMGSVVKIDGDKAQVFFPIDSTQVVVPIASLEKTSDRFGGYARVQVSAMQRSMFKRKGLA